MAYLSVNLDAIASMRSIRKIGEPDPCQAAVLAELAGADGIIVSLQRGRTAIHERDLYLLKGIVKTRFMMQMPAVEEFVNKAAEIKPWMVIFVAEQANVELPATTIDFRNVSHNYNPITANLAGLGVNSAFYVEPDGDEVKGAAKAGASAVLINCSHYAEARSVIEAQRELDRIDSAVQAASRAELTVMCGRGLNYKNIQPLAQIEAVDEFAVGFAVCARAALVGVERATGEMRAQVAGK